MKRSMIALSMVALLSLSACAGGHSGDWTPMSEGRTAGEGTVSHGKMKHKADRAFSHSMRK